jgi:hypothetical protein
MKKFDVEIIETLSKVVEIEAESETHAIIIATEMYNDEEFILDSSNHIETNFIKID